MGCYVFKEKLKLLKGDLKSWNDSNFDSIDHNIESLHKEILELDLVDECLA